MACALQYLIQGSASAFQPGARIVRVCSDCSSKNGMPGEADSQYPHKRQSRRAKIVQPLRVRSSEPTCAPLNRQGKRVLLDTRHVFLYFGLKHELTDSPPPSSRPHAAPDEVCIEFLYTRHSSARWRKMPQRVFCFWAIRFLEENTWNLHSKKQTGSCPR